MELVRINPSDSILSGNPLPVLWYVSPWTETIRNSNVYVLLSVLAEIVPGSDSYIEVYNQKMIPSDEGGIKVDLSSIVHPHLDWLVPNPDARQPIYAGQQYKRFKVDATLMQNGQPVETNTFTSEIIKAGASYDGFDAEYYSLTNAGSFFNEQKFLLPGGGNYRVHEQDVFYLFFLKPEGVGSVKARYSLTYALDNAETTVSGDIGGTVDTLDNNEVWAIPAGFNQSGIVTALPANATPVKYSIEAQDGSSNIIAEAVSFKVDNRPLYDNAQLLYRNSLGGLDPLRLYGSNEVMAEYRRDEVQRVAPPAYIVNDAVKAAIGQVNDEAPAFKANTGWLSRAEALRLRDFLLSREVWAVSGGKLIPVRLTGNKVIFYSTKDDLVSVTVEYSHAFANKFYSEKQPVAGACPAVKAFSWKQSSTDRITVYWAFPFGHELGEVSVSFPGHPVQRYRLEGNAGSAGINIPRPAGVTTDVSLTVTCKVICNENTSPVTAGPESSTPAQTYKATLPIVVNNDVFASTIQAVPFVLDGSVLDNDVDPEQEGLETQVQTNVGPNANFKYNIDAQGKITVTVLNTTTGATYSSNPYNVRRKGGGAYSTGYFTVIFKAGEQFIYVKLFVRNTRVQNSTTFGDVFIETFKDAACTQPTTVNNLTVNYKRIDKAWVSGYSSTTDETELTVNMANTGSVKVYSGSIAYANRGGGSSTTFVVLAGADYVKV